MCMMLFAFAAAVGLGMSGCDKSQADSSPSGDAQDASAQNEQSKTINLCEAYTSCDACISGQIGRGNTEGEAETQCGLAVTGCWVTWDKPIICGEHSYDERPS